MTTITASLWITMIGIVLIIVAILLLWGLMEVLMKLTAKSAAAEKAEADAAGDEVALIEAPALSAPSVLKQRAAATAVAVAMALKGRRSAEAASAAPAAGNAWQAVMRSAAINQRNTNFTRKSRGKER